MVVALLFCVVALLFYGFAPEHYSYGYCVAVLAIYLLNFLYVQIRVWKYEKAAFHLLFSISFCFCNFIYPVFVFPDNPNYSFFSLPFNVEVISTSTGLALVAYAIYSLGIMSSFRISTTSRSIIVAQEREGIRSSIRIPYLFMTLGVFILFVMTGGLAYFRDTYLQSSEIAAKKGVAQYLYLVLFPMVMVMGASIINTKSKVWIKYVGVCLITISTLILFTGSRTFPLSIYVLLFYVYSQRKNLSARSVFLFLFVGTIIMALIGSVRSSGVLTSLQTSNVEENENWYDYALDLIVNNRSLYVVYDFVHENFVTCGLTMLSNILSPLPFAQSFLFSLLGIPNFMASSPAFVTFLGLGAGSNVGLGTNIVADVYLAFGFCGVLLFFYFLGRIVSFARLKMSQQNFSWTIVYVVLMSDAIYLCRASFFNSLRTIVWALIIYKLVNSFTIGVARQNRK